MAGRCGRRQRLPARPLPSAGLRLAHPPPLPASRCRLSPLGRGSPGDSLAPRALFGSAGPLQPPGRAGQGRAGLGQAPPGHPPAKPMSAAPVRSPTLRPHRMKKDESFLGKLGGTLARKKKAREGEFVRAKGRKESASDRRDLPRLPLPRPVPSHPFAGSLRRGTVGRQAAGGTSPPLLLFASPRGGRQRRLGRGLLEGGGGGGVAALCPRSGGSPGGTRGLARLSPAGGRRRRRRGGRALRAPCGAPNAAGGRLGGWGAVGSRGRLPGGPCASRRTPLWGGRASGVHRRCPQGRRRAWPPTQTLPGSPCARRGTSEPAFCCKINFLVTRGAVGIVSSSLSVEEAARE